MSEQQPVRLRRLNIRLTQAEYDKIASHSANTTCRSISEYCRKVLTNKPVRVYYRNKSFDEFEQRMIRIMPFLEASAHRLDEAIKALPRADDIPAMKLYLTAVHSAVHGFKKNMEEIKENLVAISDQCAQK